MQSLRSSRNRSTGCRRITPIFTLCIAMIRRYRSVSSSMCWTSCTAREKSGNSVDQTGRSLGWMRRTRMPDPMVNEVSSCYRTISASRKWSRQGRGFFTDRAGRDKFDDPALVNCWYSDVNFARRDRVHELARRLNVSPAQVALAYLFVQPFPVFPLIGPASLAELRDSMGALRVNLSGADANWLRTGEVAPS